MKQVTGNKALGSTLRQYRLRSKKSLRSVAKKVGISSAHLSRIETGQRGADEHVLIALAREILPKNAEGLYEHVLELSKTLPGRPFDPERWIMRVRDTGSEFLSRKNRMDRAIGDLLHQVSAVSRDARRRGNPAKVEEISRVIEAITGRKPGNSGLTVWRRVEIGS